eukprot:Opistho-2@40569
MDDTRHPDDEQKAEVTAVDAHQVDVPLSVLKGTFGIDEFRPFQRDAVDAVLRGMDALVVLPTGAGKSLCFQVPALCTPVGIAVVVSPLIALMEDQVVRLRSNGIAAAHLSSTLSKQEQSAIVSDINAVTPTTRLLYVTPERMATKGFRSVLQGLHARSLLRFMAVDEAHCVSEWGHSFRHDYLELGIWKSLFPTLPCIAFTATATERVQSDIIRLLHMHDPVRVKASVARTNLTYSVLYKELVDDPIEHLCEWILGLSSENGGSAPASNRKRGPTLASFFEPVRNRTKTEDDGSASTQLGKGVGAVAGGAPAGAVPCGIVYCHTRQSCEEVAAALCKRCISAVAYHAGLANGERAEAQAKWSAGEVPVVAATVSFGMGIDKADVRFVAHWCLPASLEAYYQESGRAGRDGLPSVCRMYYSRKERDLRLFLMSKDVNGTADPGVGAGGGGGKGRPAMTAASAKAQTESFNSLIGYAEGVLCRHSAIARYFGENLAPCGTRCDACADPAGVAQQARLFAGAAVTGASRKGGRAKDFIRDATDAIALPRREAYDDDGGSDARDSYNGESRRRRRDDEDNEEISEMRRELAERTRRRSSLAEANHRIAQERARSTKNYSGPIIDAADDHIASLQLSVREHCYGLLRDAVIANRDAQHQQQQRQSAENDACSGSDVAVQSATTPEDVAAAVEHDCFVASKIDSLYKSACMRALREVRDATKGGRVYRRT